MALERQALSTFQHIDNIRDWFAPFLSYPPRRNLYCTSCQKVLHYRWECEKCSAKLCWLCCIKNLQKKGYFQCPSCSDIDQSPHIFNVGGTVMLIRKSNSRFSYEDGFIELMVELAHKNVCWYEPCFSSWMRKIPLKQFQEEGILSHLPHWNKKCSSQALLPFESLEEVLYHTQIFHQQFCCKICYAHKRPQYLYQIKFFTLKRLKAHLKYGDFKGNKHKPAHPFCSICKLPCYDQKRYDEHMLMSHYVCSLCSKSQIENGTHSPKHNALAINKKQKEFKDLFSLKKHLEESHYKCKYGCSLVLDNPFDWTDHMKSKHPNITNLDLNLGFEDIMLSLMYKSGNNPKNTDPIPLINIARNWYVPFLNFDTRHFPDCPICNQTMHYCFQCTVCESAICWLCCLRLHHNQPPFNCPFCRSVCPQPLISLYSTETVDTPIHNARRRLNFQDNLIQLVLELVFGNFCWFPRCVAHWLPYVIDKLRNDTISKQLNFYPNIKLDIPPQHQIDMYNFNGIADLANHHLHAHQAYLCPSCQASKHSLLPVDTNFYQLDALNLHKKECNLFFSDKFQICPLCYELTSQFPGKLLHYRSDKHFCHMCLEQHGKSDFFSSKEHLDLSEDANLLNIKSSHEFYEHLSKVHGIEILDELSTTSPISNVNFDMHSNGSPHKNGHDFPTELSSPNSSFQAMKQTELSSPLIYPLNYFSSPIRTSSSPYRGYMSPRRTSPQAHTFRKHANGKSSPPNTNLYLSENGAPYIPPLDLNTHLSSNGHNSHNGNSAKIKTSKSLSHRSEKNKPIPKIPDIPNVMKSQTTSHPSRKNSVDPEKLLDKPRIKTPQTRKKVEEKPIDIIEKPSSNNTTKPKTYDNEQIEPENFSLPIISSKITKKSNGPTKIFSGKTDKNDERLPIVLPLISYVSNKSNQQKVAITTNAVTTKHNPSYNTTTYTNEKTILPFISTITPVNKPHSTLTLPVPKEKLTRAQPQENHKIVKKKFVNNNNISNNTAEPTTLDNRDNIAQSSKSQNSSLSKSGKSPSDYYSHTSSLSLDNFSSLSSTSTKHSLNIDFQEEMRNWFIPFLPKPVEMKKCPLCNDIMNYRWECKACKHTICWVCSLRSHHKSNGETRCPYCNTPDERPHLFMKNKNSDKHSIYNPRFNISFEDRLIELAVSLIFENICWFGDCRNEWITKLPVHNLIESRNGNHNGYDPSNHNTINKNHENNPLDSIKEFIFTSEKALLKHVENKHHCTVCQFCSKKDQLKFIDLKYYDSEELHKHHMEGDITSIPPIMPHPKCNICGELFANYSAYFKHIKKAHFVCKKCFENVNEKVLKEEKFNTGPSRMSANEMAKFKIEQYSKIKVFGTAAELTEHINSSHFVCTFGCNSLEFDNIDEFIKHMKKAHPTYSSDPFSTGLLH